MTRAAVLVFVLAALLLPAAARAQGAPLLPPGFALSTAWTVPGYATAFRFAPDGRVFVASKEGVVSVFDGPGDSTPTTYADLRLQVYDGWDRGLLGLAVDPAFTTGRPYVYVLYTYDKAPDSPLMPRWSDVCPTPPGPNDDGCVVTARLSRIAPDGTETVLLDDFCQQFTSHSIGALNFGPDGALYVSAGEGAAYNAVDYGQHGIPLNPCGDPPGGVGAVQAPPDAEGGALRAQSFARPASEPATLEGAILRVDPDTGAALPDNPAASNPDPVRRRIVAYGMRNPFRFTFRPGTGELWVGDVGFGAWEEIDRVPDITRVRNYGWPCYEGAVHQDSYEALGLTTCDRLYGSGAVVAPYWAYYHNDPVVPGDGCGVGTSSISGLAFYDAALFPAAYRDALFFADYSRGCLWVIHAGANGLPDPATLETFATGASGVDLQVGPDGALYYAELLAGEIRRIAPIGGGPTARLSATPASGDAPLRVRFDGSASEGGPLTYAWDLDGDGAYDDSTATAPTRTYTSEGYVDVGLRVTDEHGSGATATKRLTVGTPPKVSIAAPAEATTWAVGDTVAFQGSAAGLPASALRWTLDLRHCSRTNPASCHTHHIQDFAGVANGSFVAPDHEYPAHLQLSLTATDPSNGLTSTTTVELQPRTATVSLASSPLGLRLGFGTETAVTPFTRTVIARSVTAVAAGSPQSLDGRTYAFGEWDDGLAQVHAVTAPAEGTVSHSVRYGVVPDVRLAGTETVGDDVSTAWPGRAEVYRMTAATTGTALALRLRLDEGSQARKLVVAVYADGDQDAGALLGSGTLLDPVAGAWNEVRLSSAVPLVAGARYWFSVLNPKEPINTQPVPLPLRWRDKAGSPRDLERTSESLELTALPSQWRTALFYPDGAPISGAAYGVPPGTRAPALPAPTATPLAPAPTPTPTPRPPARLPRVSVPGTLTLSHAGTVAVRLACPATTACRFTVTIARVGKRSATVRAGKAVMVHLRPPASTRASLRRHRHLRVRVTITRRVGAATATAARYARISAPSSRATSAA